MEHRVIQHGANREISSRRSRLSKIAVVCALSCGLLASCTSPRNTLGTTVSPCFRVLGLAEQAVKRIGHYDGVQQVSRTALIEALGGRQPGAIALPRSFRAKVGPICVVLYQGGDFDATAVRHPWPSTATSGRYAIVAIALGQPRIEATILIQRVPLSFTRLFSVIPLKR